MKRLAAATAIISGVLLVLVPRYILPACEYEGFPAMHCSDTAHAEFVTGGLMTAAGILIAFSKSTKALLAGAAASLILDVAAFVLPDIFGYCRSSRMPCNYGMVPGVRFVAVVGGVIMMICIVSTVRKSLRKGIA